MAGNGVGWFCVLCVCVLGSFISTCHIRSDSCLPLKGARSLILCDEATPQQFWKMLQKHSTQMCSLFPQFKWIIFGESLFLYSAFMACFQSLHSSDLGPERQACDKRMSRFILLSACPLTKSHPHKNKR